jgi:RNA polymerase sigma-70 factor (ECF subfamily)
MTDIFAERRSMLFGIAYRMLGSVADAEDVLQDAWLRWSAVRTPVDKPEAYLARIVTNLCLNKLRSAAAKRESYVGPWLPEPLLAGPDDASETVELAESISLGMLVVLERLSPLERAVFVLREVFGYSFEEVAAMLNRTPASVRQVGHRARSHVQARRPRFDASDELRRQVTEEFMAACVSGDLGRVMSLLAPDVTVWTDGGGKVRAALRPLHGLDAVSRWIAGVLGRFEGDFALDLVEVNGRLGVLVTSGGEVDSVADFDILDGKITAIRAIRNPDKLRSR